MIWLRNNESRVLDMMTLANVLSMSWGLFGSIRTPNLEGLHFFAIAAILFIYMANRSDDVPYSSAGNATG